VSPVATIETREPMSPSVRRAGSPRRVRVVIRRVNPLSVLKFSLLFYFCLMLVGLVGLSILYTILASMGVIENFEKTISSVGVYTNFEIDPGYLLRTLAIIGLISTVLWAAVTVFVAFLYNLIADLVGGIEVTLSEKG